MAAGIDPIEGFKIGIVWQGSRDYASIVAFDSLGRFCAAGRPPGVRLVSLQKGFGSEQIAAVDFRCSIWPIGWTKRPAFHGYRGRDPQPRPGGGARHGGGPLGRRLGVPVFLAIPLLADWRLVAWARRFPVVSRRTTVSSNDAGRLVRGLQHCIASRRPAASDPFITEYKTR